MRRGAFIATCRDGPCPLLEMLEKRRRYEAGAGGIEMLVAPGCLLVRIEALWNDQHELILSARHGDVEQASLLFDVVRASRPQVGGDAAVTALRMKTLLHSWPLAEWIVDKIK